MPPSSSTIRSLLSKSPRISTLLPTKDTLLGAELVLLSSTRELLRSSYRSQISSGDYDVVTTSIDTSVSFLHSHGLFEDLSRDNDVSYYKVGRGKKGVDEETGEEYSFETQKLGFRHCIPRTLVSEGEKRMFAGMMLQIAVDELNTAREEERGRGGGEGALPLVGASVFMDRTVVAEGALNVEELLCLENQMVKAAAANSSAPDLFVVEGCENRERLEQLKELMKRNEKKMITLEVPTTTGHYKKNDFETEIGFNIPTVVIRDGKIDEIL